MSDPLRTDGSRAHDAESGSDRDAKIEQLLLVGLDHYFASHYELAINVWTRALFLDRSHARARAYIERARSALAEGQRESEELLQNGLAAFKRGDGDEARRLLQAAIDRGAPSEDALAALERLTRLEAAAAPPAAPRLRRASRDRAPRVADTVPRSTGRALAFAMAGVAVAGLVAFGVYTDRVDWRPMQDMVELVRVAGRASAPVQGVSLPVGRESALPVPRRGETALARARALTASGRLHDALAILESVRPTDPQKADADRLRADIQRQLLALTSLPAAVATSGEKGDRRLP
jgi:tetratricopeptide (TPR) repeat protein